MINFIANNKLTEQINIQSFGFWFLLLLSLIVLDQFSKWLAEFLHAPIFLNDNFAFSLSMPVWLIYGIYLIVFMILFKYLYDQWNSLPAFIRLGFVLILAGGISNVGERIVLGSVRDFIFIGTGVLNIADFFILFGMGTILINWWAKPKQIS